MSEIVPNSSSEIEGNNRTSISKKQVSPSVRWCFTHNNYNDKDIDMYSSTIREYCKVGFFSKEIGDSGTPHLQGYIEFKKKDRPLSKFCKGANWEKALGNKLSNWDYITNSPDKGVSQELAFSFGRVPQKVKTIAEHDFYLWQIKALQIVKGEISDRHIHWFYDKEGGVGKTAFCKYLTVFHGAICLGGKAADCRNGIVEYMKNNDGETPELILINIPRSFNSDYLSYEALENIKDMYFYSGKYEGGQVCGNPPHLMVFSNEEPDYEKCTQDRWQVHNCNKKKKETLVCSSFFNVPPGKVKALPPPKGAPQIP